MPSELKTFLSHLTRIEQPKGPAAAYTPAHVVKALMILESKQVMGRIALSKALGVGEGSVRTMIKKLVENGLIAVDSVGGCVLTRRGKAVANELKEIVVGSSEVDLRDMEIQPFSYALHLRMDLSNASLTKLRDVAVKYGAEGMVILAMKKGLLSMPLMVDDASKTYPNIVGSMKSKFQMRDGDFLLIGFSKGLRDAELGTLAAALYLISS